MDAVEDYARKWTKREKEQLDTLSEWVKSVRSLIQIRISKLRRSMSKRGKSVFSNPDAAKTLSTIHEKYVVLQTRPLITSFLSAKPIIYNV